MSLNQSAVTVTVTKPVRPTTAQPNKRETTTAESAHPYPCSCPCPYPYASIRKQSHPDCESKEYHPSISSPSIANSLISNPSMSNPSMSNPLIADIDPSISNPSVSSIYSLPFQSFLLPNLRIRPPFTSSTHDSDSNSDTVTDIKCLNRNSTSHSTSHSHSHSHSDSPTSMPMCTQRERSPERVLERVPLTGPVAARGSSTDRRANFRFVNSKGPIKAKPMRPNQTLTVQQETSIDRMQMTETNSRAHTLATTFQLSSSAKKYAIDSSH